MAAKTLIFSIILAACFILVFPKVILSQNIDRSYDRLPDQDQLFETQESSPGVQNSGFPRNKRPFCNAFTGCGFEPGKRSTPSIIDNNREFPLRRSNNLICREIGSEDRIWETIQELDAELMRRRQLAKNLYPMINE